MPRPHFPAELTSSTPRHEESPQALVERMEHLMANQAHERMAAQDLAIISVPSSAGIDANRAVMHEPNAEIEPTFREILMDMTEHLASVHEAEVDDLRVQLDLLRTQNESLLHGTRPKQEDQLPFDHFAQPYANPVSHGYMYPVAGHLDQLKPTSHGQNGNGQFTLLNHGPLEPVPQEPDFLDGEGEATDMVGESAEQVQPSRTSGTEHTEHSSAQCTDKGEVAQTITGGSVVLDMPSRKSRVSFHEKALSNGEHAEHLSHYTKSSAANSAAASTENLDEHPSASEAEGLEDSPEPKVSVGGHVPVFELWSTWTLQTTNFNDEGLPTDGDDQQVMIRPMLRSKTTTMSLGTKMANEYKLRCPRKDEIIMGPNNTKRAVWDVLGLALLAYDMVWIPMSGAFNPEKHPFTSMMDIVTMMFWTFDVVMSLTTGYLTPEGKLIKKFRLIALRYAKSAMLLDMIIVGSDWFSFIIHNVVAGASGGVTDEAGLLRLGKVMRAARIARSLRLLRLVKIRSILYMIQERIDSEWVSIFLGALQNLVMLVGVNHVAACIWWAIGNHPGDDHWVYFYHMEDLALGEKYIMSLHWSLTQFTPASMEVMPRNVGERTFTVAMILAAMIGFSSFVSSITASMMRLRDLSSSSMSKSYQLRKFLNENNVNDDLSIRITRYVCLAQEKARHKVDVSQIALLKFLTGPLRVELQRELMEPFIKSHGFFEGYAIRSHSAASEICHKAISKISFSTSDIVFSFCSEAKYMYFLSQGLTYYQRPKGTKWDNHRSGARSAIRAKRIVTVQKVFEWDDNGKHVETNPWFCEAVLWVPWVHRGTMGALVETEVVCVDANAFCQVTKSQRSAYTHAKTYAQIFVKRLNKERERHGSVWDVPREYLKHLAQQENQLELEMRGNGSLFKARISLSKATLMAATQPVSLVTRLWRTVMNKNHGPQQDADELVEKQFKSAPHESNDELDGSEHDSFEDEMYDDGGDAAQVLGKYLQSSRMLSLQLPKKLTDSQLKDLSVLQKWERVIVLCFQRARKKEMRDNS